MKRFVLAALVAVGILTATAQPANASIWIHSDFTLLTTSQWTPLPNSVNHACPSGTCAAQFTWASTPPGQDTTIRTVGCAGNENGRKRIPAGSSYYYVIAFVQAGGCVRFQGRMPTEVGNMHNLHWYEAWF